jgi:hypothetical protein
MSPSSPAFFSSPAHQEIRWSAVPDLLAERAAA